MKTINIRQLHEATGKYVRESAQYPLLILERGRPVAVLQKATPLSESGVGLPERESVIRKLPRINQDSTQAISEDRDRL
ncbi:MAG: hypothetical protein SFY92_02335 [Verrucomicrobiae bacterium]|nr:hypothetical protein [Verrucomicrobiae bacterium]